MRKSFGNCKAATHVDGTTLVLSGDWNWCNIDEQIVNTVSFDPSTRVIDASKIGLIDTTGAFFINKLVNLFDRKDIKIEIYLNDKHKKLYFLVLENLSFDSEVESQSFRFDTVYRIGLNTWQYLRDFIYFIRFIGEVSDASARIAFAPWQVRTKLILDIVYSAGYQAIWIVCLLAFLIGIVLAYQIGGQLVTYGANIFVVNLLGISLLREFAPLITAIIVAGRSGSAFAAQIGTMKVQEELDALRTFGIPPIRRLVLPRMVGLIISLPLLVIFADIASVFGGMIMSKIFLGLDYAEFIHQFGKSISFSTYMAGLIKAPVFALIIAAVGCYRGLSVKGDAASIGEETTKSVVYSIFLIIIVDAIFSILFSVVGV